MRAAPLDLLLRSASLHAAEWKDALRFGFAAWGVMGVDLMMLTLQPAPRQQAFAGQLAVEVR